MRAEACLENRMENRTGAIVERMDQYMAYKQEDINERVQKLKRVFREVVLKETDKIEPRTFIIS